MSDGTGITTSSEGLLATSRKAGMTYVVFCLPWLAMLGWLAGVAWFLTDDAFISFRYVRNLLEGHGLVFNPGEYVEGYSNFLWVLELAAIWELFGVPPELAAQWLSVTCTAGTLAMMLWWAARLPSLRHRGLVAWMALGLLCSSATVAVWTSAGGLETRQFTFFVVLAVVSLSLYRHSRWGLLAASLSLAAAAYTRPEGPLLAACCFGWFAVQSLATAGRLNRRAATVLVAPFIILVAAHFLFRYGYYGEWLPNTYYAKHVRPWYEAGIFYLLAAALETGLYLLIPLAFVALHARWQNCRDGTYGLVLLCIAVHMAWLMRIGGDHFEYRPMDFYWPLLAVPAAEGIIQLGSRVSTGLRRRFAAILFGIEGRGIAMMLFLPVLFYANAVQGALLFEGAAIRERIIGLHVALHEENAGWLLAAPGMPILVAISNELRRKLTPRAVAIRFTEHREFANQQMRRWKGYEKMERGIIPDDALMASCSVGIRFYHVPNLRVVDICGLTDATVARSPVTRPNHKRVMAHDRQPPPGYLERRGVNFTLRPHALTEVEALDRAHYAVKIGPDLWMPFDTSDPEWAAARFAGHDLRVRKASSTTESGKNPG